MTSCRAALVCKTFILLAADLALGLHIAGRGVASEADGSYLDCSWNASVASKFHLGVQELPSWPCTQRPQFAMQNRRKTIVCIGDSITHGSNVARDESYPADLFASLHQKFNVLNLGVSAATVQKEPAQAYWTLPHWKVALETPFEVAIIQLGTNDAKERYWDESSFKHDYLEFIQQLAQTHPEAEIILSIPPPASENNFTIQPEVVGSQLKEAILSVRLEAGLRSTPMDMQNAFVSAEASSLKQRTPPHLMQKDNVHPTADGYTVIAAVVADKLRHDLLPLTF